MLSIKWFTFFRDSSSFLRWDLPTSGFFRYTNSTCNGDDKGFSVTQTDELKTRVNNVQHLMPISWQIYITHLLIMRVVLESHVLPPLTVHFKIFLNSLKEAKIEHVKSIEMSCFPQNFTCRQTATYGSYF